MFEGYSFKKLERLSSSSSEEDTSTISSTVGTFNGKSLTLRVINLINGNLHSFVLRKIYKNFFLLTRHVIQVWFQPLQTPCTCNMHIYI